ncbi:MAG: hypothetical protein KatS3mg131_2779 [Candidatus Tectimicrobiota bacterium]|nr:MAG: hypothetical protein KatS3mg131_2779 [Candidatus Tectomicrobia bacterium]
MLGSALFMNESRFWEEMPNSSAWMRPNATHLMMSNHWSSPWRTTGPRGSLDITTPMTTWSCGRLRVVFCASSCEMSEVTASQRPLS